VVLGGAPSCPLAVMVAWFEMVPLTVPSTVTRNFTTMLAPMTIVPP